MHKNPGLRKEEEIVLTLNNKKVKDLSNNFKYLLREMFGPLDEDEVIYSNLVGGFQKPDFYIEYKFRRLFVSMKSGQAKIVHQEKLETFVQFLKDIGMTPTCLEVFLRHHFADGTTDGTGKERMSYSETEFKMKDDIRRFNKVVNSNKDLIAAVVDRCTFTGSQVGNIPADYLYFGDKDYGSICSRAQVRKHLFRKSWFYMDNLHIGPLQFRPHARLLDKRENEEGRFKVDAWWSGLEREVVYISERYNG